MQDNNTFRESAKKKIKLKYEMEILRKTSQYLMNRKEKFQTEIEMALFLVSRSVVVRYNL